MIQLDFVCADGRLSRSDIGARHLVLAGWTGRDPASVQAHIEELAALGVSRPDSTPLVYRVASRLAGTHRVIEVVGKRTSGEAEFVLFKHAGELWVGVGSDHTCRATEATSVAVSKQCCDKPMSQSVWRFDDVRSHWDALELRSYATLSGQVLPYQSCSVAHILPPHELIALCDAKRIDLEACLLFCGTVPLISPWTHADEFQCELHDPVLGRSLECGYAVHVIE